MTRIGFAYNQKPEPLAPVEAETDEALPPDEEPPSTRRDARSRNSDSPASIQRITGAALASPLTSVLPTSDEFAEWDSEETIDAVANALAELGEVIRLEATEDFPSELRDARPDLVFNIAEGLLGVNREAHVPAICEFYGVPYTGSDPFTLALCLDKARAKEILSYHGVPNARFVVIRELGDLRRLLATLGKGRSSSRSLTLPLFAKPLHEGSSKGITERNFCDTRESLEAQVEHLLATYQQPV